MSDTPRPKGAKVKIPVGSTTGHDEHKDANLIEVHDGHLFVKDHATKRNIAIYAPQKWLSVTLG